MSARPDLHAPLGAEADARRAAARARRASLIRWGLAFGALAVASLAAYVTIDAGRSDDIVVAVSKPAPSAPPAVRPAPAPVPAPSPAPDAGSDEGVLKPLSPLEPAPDDAIDRAPPSPEEARSEGAPDFRPRVAAPSPRPWLPRPELLEQSEFGPLPKVGPTGIRPLDAHARPPAGTGAARRAIVVGGLGLSQTGTQDAIRDLPSEVTLGFSPFGNSLQRWSQQALREGHEVVLQLPMEPLGYPAVDPGPRTLVSGTPKGEMLRRLRWSLGRMTNYPVTMNYLGAGLLAKPGELE